jgi:ATP-binding cassette subfamily B protein
VSSSVVAALRRLPSFLGYVLRVFPLARVTLALTVLLLVFEYAVFSLMIPLAANDGASGGQSGGSVLRFWTAVAQALHLPPSQLTWLWLFVVLLCARTVLGYVHLLLSNWVSKQVHRHLSARTFERVVMHEPMTEIYRRSIGHYITLAGDDTFRAGTIINTASQALGSLTSVFAGFVLLYLFSPPVLWGTLAFLAACAMAIAACFRMLLSANMKSVVASREASTAYVEALNGLRSLRSMASEAYFVGSYNDQIRRYVRLLFEIDAMKSSMKFLPGVLALLAGMVVLWPGGERSGALTASYFFAVTTLLMRVFIALGSMVNTVSTLLMDVRAASDIHELIGPSRPQESRDTEDARVEVGEIRLCGIHYGYAQGGKVLDGLDFEFRRGETVAIVGPSGAGKSTLADMLLGLIRPQSGAISIDSADSIAALRRHIVLVEQQARVFSSSVRENLLLGLRRDDAVLWDALRQVGLDQHVRSLPHGLDSEFEYQGANLSGGQRQRLGIARALIRDPQVLILDEATSALDPKTREFVVGNLRSFMKERILVFITHDETLAQTADVVLHLGPAGVDMKASRSLA